MDGETRPTFASAFASDSGASGESTPEAASPAAEPVTETPVAESASAATTEPPATAEPVAEPSAPGTPPQERWPDILKNARAKEREAALAEWRQQYGWAEQVNQQQLQEMAQWYQQAAADPVSFTLKMLDDLTTNQQYAPQIRSHAARILGQRGIAQSQAEAPIEPGIPVMDEQGHVVARTYTDAQIQQLIDRSVQAALGKEVGPIKERFQKQEQAELQRSITTEATTKASALLKEAESWPGFVEHKDAIAKAYEANPSFTLEQAYLSLLKSDILPSLTKAEEAKVLTNLQTKAAASALNPATAAQSAPKRPKNFYEAFGVER